MSKIISPGYTDTAIVGDPVLVRGKLNFGADFRVQSDSKGEMILTNITSPLDRGETIQQSYSNISNIYEKTGIDPSVYAPSKRGVNIYTKLSDTYAVTDSVDADFLQHLPVSVSIVVRTASSEYLTAADVQTVVARAVSCLYDTDDESTTRLNAILRGSLRPSDL